jgi:O-antigen/teichoic acid export membrane protein
MSRKTSIARQVTTTFGTKIIGFFFSFIGSIFLIRLLGVEGKGVQAFIYANVNLFATFFGFNVLTTLTYFVAKEHFDAAAARGLMLLINGFGILVFISAILTLFFIDSPVLDFIIPEGYQSSFFITYLIIFFLNGVSTPFFRGNWTGQAKFNIINGLVLLSSAMSAIIFSTTWFLQKKNLITLSLEQVLTISLVITLLLFLLRIAIFIYSREKISFKIKKVIRPILLFGSMGWMAGVMNFGVRRIDFWFVEYHRSIEQLGYYALAASLVEIIISLVLPATSVLSPYLTNANTEKREALLGRFSRITIAMMSVIIIIALPLINPMLPFLYGTEFTGAVLPLQILCVGGLLLIVGNIFYMVNIATNNLGPNFFAILASLIVTLVLDFLLVSKYGIIGASWVSVVAYGTSTLILMISVLGKATKPISFFLIFKKDDFNYLTLKLKSLFSK